MSGLYMFTCPVCRSIVDYGCMCDEPQPHDRWEGHDSFEAAKARADEMRPPNASAQDIAA